MTKYLKLLLLQKFEMTPFFKFYQSKIILPRELEAKAEDIRKKGSTIATLNGSFDLLHAGHLHILYEASIVADVLIVALNSDSSIQQYKSSKRPIISLEYRLQMMSAIGFVDFVTWFDEITPMNFISRVKPNVHVNGSEYGERCIEYDTVVRHGGRVHIVPLIPGLSTSEIINKIHRL